MAVQLVASGKKEAQEAPLQAVVLTLLLLPILINVLREEDLRDGKEKIRGCALVILIEPVDVDHDGWSLSGK
jgi:hypothetical protein